MTPNDIRQRFNRIYNGQRNFMTPDIIRYGQRGGHLYELSEGEFMGQTIWGVTVLTAVGEPTNLSKCHASLKDAEDHIKSLGARS